MSTSSRFNSLSGLKKSIEKKYSGPLKRPWDGTGRSPPVNNYMLYSKLFPNAAISDVSSLIRETRMVKSEHELRLIRQAARMNDALFSAVGEILKEGMSEIEFAGLLEAQ